MPLSYTQLFNLRASIILLLLSGLLSCGNNQDDSQPSAKKSQPTSNKSTPVSPQTSQQQPTFAVATSLNKSTAIENQPRNWQQIQALGIIRALKLEWEQENSLPRSGSTSLLHIELFKQFAKKYHLKIEWVKVKNLDQMFRYLNKNQADLIPRHLTITQKRNKIVAFTQPIMQDVELLVAKKGTKVPNENSVVEVSLPKRSAYIESIKNNFPHWQINILEKALTPDEIADALVSGKIKYSLLDGQSVNTLMSYRTGLSTVFSLPKRTKLAWAVNPNNSSLLDKLNEFIAVHHIALMTRKSRNIDFKKLKQKKLALRMITRNSPETYFLWRGELMGFEYELMKKFTDRNNLRLEIVVAENYQQMKKLLIDGKGDVIAAGLSRIDERRDELQFTSRYNRVSELLVAHKNSLPIRRLSDLRGRVITIRKSSAFWATAKNLANQYGVQLIAADENMATEMLIDQVADKKIDLTIADNNLTSIELRFRDNIVTPLVLKERVPYAYVVRKDNKQLLNALNGFIKKEYRGTFYNVIKAKYFTSKKRLARYRQERIKPGSDLSPYDQLVKDQARKYQFDWRMITSQMFQESRFDANASSPAGAKGLMQVLPKTAKELGFLDLNKPDQAIAAGIQYLDWTRARFSAEIPLEERVFFALAAYNAGFGHVRDAQQLAKEQGLKPDRWFDNVEKTMLLLQQPEYYKKARFGYCRGSEPVNYVRAIQQRYLSYVDMTH